MIVPKSIGFASGSAHFLPPRWELLVGEANRAPFCAAAQGKSRQKWPMGSAIKYWVAYEKPFWRERGLNGILQSDQPPSEFISGDFTPSEGRLACWRDSSKPSLWRGPGAPWRNERSSW